MLVSPGEFASHRLLSRQGLAPPLLARFYNGLLYRFIQGRVCIPSDLARAPVWRGVARRLGEWHAVLPIDMSNSQTAEHATNGVAQQPYENGIIMPSHRGKQNFSTNSISENPTSNLWTVMQKWVSALPEATEAENERKLLLQSELQRLVTELSKIVGLGEDGVRPYHSFLV